MEIAARLRQHVEYLATAIGERSPMYYRNLERAREYIEQIFSEVGYAFNHDVYQVRGKLYRNVIVEKKGRVHPQQILLIGAHYDTAPGTPGADDNASGIASLLEIARLLSPLEPPMTIRLVAFTLEEPPHFHSRFMGSVVHAKKCQKRNDNIVGMISLEMVGYFDDRENSQAYPLPLMGRFYPNQGNFIAVAGNFRSRHLVRRVTDRLTQESDIRVESTALPFVPGVGLSDNWSFWQQGYAAVMITDTSFFRNPHYHLPSDLPDTLDYQRMSALVSGLAKVSVRF
ncbi:M28 family peptidase [Acidobacteria bacterium AH-259-L09]|nr:M28 family peptidase [Acidobacteria bacterium AH-259-L09]